MICALKPLDESKVEIKKQEREVSAAKWLPIEEFYERSSDFNTTFLDAYLEKRRKLIHPTHFKHMYNEFDRHMIMYFCK